jgi:phosphoribosyl 1,2-cyclic phosphodiesterase
VITFSLQSGSNGNSIYVEAGEMRLLFDAGLSAREAQARMAVHGRDLRDCQALIISHDHVDHVRGAGTYHRRFGMPVYMTQGAYTAVKRQLGSIRALTHFSPGDCLTFGDVRVHTLRTPHDGIDTVCFIVEHAGRRLGIMTDLGHPFRGLVDALEGLDAAYLEANYDPHLLRSGRYAEPLKRRIAGRGGHLSNEEAAGLAGGVKRARLQWLAAAHLSEENNRPELAMEAIRRHVGRELPALVASRYEVSSILEVR